MERLHRQTTRRRELLKSLKAARDAVAHEDEPRLATLRAAGYRIDLTWIPTVALGPERPERYARLRHGDAPCSLVRRFGAVVGDDGLVPTRRPSVVPWVLDEVPGTVIDVFGPGVGTFVIVRVDRSKPDDDDNDIGFRADDIRHAPVRSAG